MNISEAKKSWTRHQKNEKCLAEEEKFWYATAAAAAVAETQLQMLMTCFHPNTHLIRSRLLSNNLIMKTKVYFRHSMEEIQ